MTYYRIANPTQIHRNFILAQSDMLRTESSYMAIEGSLANVGFETSVYEEMAYAEHDLTILRQMLRLTSMKPMLANDDTGFPEEEEDLPF